MTDTIFTHDAATVSWDSVETDGITVDDGGEATFDWSEIPVVRLDEPPHAQAFDTNEFYKIEGATVARPIKQPYRVGDSIETYKKPADELRKMAWSLDNVPFTTTHPNTGMVKDVGDIHGFWKAPRYDDDEDRLKEDLYVPTNDSEATEFISENQDVSIGFYNRIHEEYDGDTGDLTDDDVDGFQVNMYGDHIAGVKTGRCSSEEGCGLDSADGHGHVVMAVDETTSFITKKDQTGEKSDKKVAEHERRKQSEDSDCGCGNNEEDTTMSENEDGFDIPDMSIDALAERHDTVASIREEKDELKATVAEVREELDEHNIDLDEDECPCDAIHDLAESKDEAESRVEELEEELDDYREEERMEALDELSEYLNDVSIYEDSSLDEIEDELERVQNVADNLNVDVKNVGTDSGEESDSARSKQYGRGHAANH